MKKILVFTLVLALSLALLSGCQSGGSSSSSSGSSSNSSADAGTEKGPILQKIESAKELVMYTDPNFPPYEFVEGNDTVGVDIEIGKAIAEKLGVKLTIQSAEFDGIVAAIASGKGHIAISGMTITEERQKEVDFSDPYIKSVQYLILPEGSNLETIEDLAGKKVGVAVGYTGSLILDDEIKKGVLKDKNTTAKEYNSALEACLDINNGKLDAVIMDELVSQNIVKNNEGLKTMKLVYEDGSNLDEEFGVVVPKGNEDLVKIINEVVSELKASGKIDEFVVEFSK